MAEECSGCGLVSEIHRLEKENQRLRVHIEELQEYTNELEKAIRRMQRALLRIWQYVVKILNETRPTLSKRSGVPRGIWAYCVGADEVAEEVGDLIQEVASG